jgi:acetyl-CoA C-acetyltransferase
VPAFTINKVCGSGLKSIALAYESIALGHSELVIAGGHESMSNAMHASYVRAGMKAGDLKAHRYDDV